MALPQSLRTSVTPPELELIASEQLIDIVPLVTMEKTAFISVSRLRSNLPLLSEMVRHNNRRYILMRKGCLWSATSSSEGSSSLMDSGEPQAEEEVSYRSTRVALSWYYHISYLSFPELPVDENVLDRITSGQTNPRNLESRFQPTPVPIRRGLEGHPRHVSWSNVEIR